MDAQKLSSNPLEAKSLPKHMSEEYCLSYWFIGKVNPIFKLIRQHVNLPWSFSHVRQLNHCRTRRLIAKVRKVCS